MIESLFSGLIKWALIAVAFISGLVWVFKRGKKEQEAEQNERIIEDVYLAQQVRRDPDKLDNAERMFKRDK